MCYVWLILNAQPFLNLLLFGCSESSKHGWRRSRSVFLLNKSMLTNFQKGKKWWIIRRHLWSTPWDFHSSTVLTACLGFISRYVLPRLFSPRVFWYTQSYNVRFYHTTNLSHFLLLSQWLDRSFKHCMYCILFQSIITPTTFSIEVFT